MPTWSALRVSMVIMRMLVATRGAVGAVFEHAHASVIASAHSARTRRTVESKGVIKTVLLPLLRRIRYRPPQKGGWHLSGKGASHLSPPKRGFLQIICRRFVRISC